jgi:beta-xylosidase
MKIKLYRNKWFPWICLILTGIIFPEGMNAAETYTNPVLVRTFNITRVNPDHFTGVLGIGDPSVILHDGRYYLYPTGDNRSYDVYISSDLVNWKTGKKVFESPAHGVWAPDVFYNPGDKKFYLYYTANRLVGAAVSDRPDGTFRDLGILVRGAIDAHMFLDDDGRYYLYYVKYPAFRIYVQPMGTPLRKSGKPVQIISPTEPWEQNHVPITEAPWIIKHDETYYLLYSGGGADTRHYAIGYAAGKTPAGPFVKHPGNPVVKEGRGIFGPGHVSVTKDRAGTLWMVYHQQKDETRGWNRIICIDRLWFDEQGVLRVKATRSTPQPAPVTQFQPSALSGQLSATE